MTGITEAKHRIEYWSGRGGVLNNDSSFFFFRVRMTWKVWEGLVCRAGDRGD